MRIPLLFFLLLLFATAPKWASAQSVPVGDPFEEYMRFLYPEDAPSHNIRPVSRLTTHDSRLPNHPWQHHQFFTRESNKIYGFYTPQFKTTWNSSFPSGQNDGALWQGRGLNSAISLGGYFDYGPLKITFRPEFVYSQNRDFERSPFKPSPSFLSDFATPMRSYDVVQRFGVDPITRFDLGQSSVELHINNFAIGFSNQNVWSGPAVQNPILFSNNAPGFLHGFIGTNKPVRTKIGDFEGRLLWGGLRESEYYDNNSRNNLRYLNAIIFNYSPTFIPGLHIGATRFFMKIFPEDGLELSDILFVGSSVIKERFQTTDNITGDDDGYQIASAFARWEFPSAGLELYGEYGKNDHFLNTRHVFVNTVHTRAFLLGGSKKWNLPSNSWLTLNLEITQLIYPRANNKLAGYYENSDVRHGYTHRGQMMGAGTDSGSFSQYGKLQYYQPWGLIGLSFNRIDLQVDRLKSNINFINNYQDGSYELHELIETEHRWGLHGLIFLPNHLELQANIYQSRFLNRYNLRGNHVWNTNVEFTLRVQMPEFKR